MKLNKKILKSKILSTVICYIVSIYIRLVKLTTIWKIEGKEHIEQLENSEKTYIIALWHGRLIIPALFIPRNRKLKAIISSHGDGKLISKVMSHLDLYTIEGSTTNGAAGALRSSFRAIKEGNILVITPDGPQGPRMRINGKIIEIAAKFNLPILPLTFATKRHKIMRSWDRFFLPLPFSSGVFIYGKPLHVSLDHKNKSGKELENRLNIINERADNYIGIEPIRPE